MLMSDPDRPEVSIEVCEASGFFEKAQGLLATRRVGPGKGLLLRAKQVHSLGMSYAIDTVHLRSDGCIIRVQTLRPWRLGPLVWSARWVLEMDAGEAERLGIRPGGRLMKQLLV